MEPALVIYSGLVMTNRLFLVKFSRTYFESSKSKDFWPTVKPFLTNKGNVNQKDTVLSENDVLITKLDEVCEIFNNFVVNVAKNIENSHPITPFYIIYVYRFTFKFSDIVSLTSVCFPILTVIIFLKFIK
jgi:hypothetical protein